MAGLGPDTLSTVPTTQGIELSICNWPSSLIVLLSSLCTFSSLLSLQLATPMPFILPLSILS